MKSDFFLKGKYVSIIPTTPHHLAEYTSWHKWEGDLSILQEEESFANQQDRARRLHLLKNDTDENSYYLSVIDTEEEIVSLLELYILHTELYIPNFILKKVHNGNTMALEAGKLLINYFFSYFKEITSIMFDLPDYRIESIKILEQFGFKKITHYYKLNYKNKWQKMIILRLGKD